MISTVLTLAFGAIIVLAVLGLILCVACIELDLAIRARRRDRARFLYGAYADGNKIMGDQWKR